MARRSKDSTARDLIELVALMPWWAGLLAALLSYLLLTAWASQPVVSGQRVNFMVVLASVGRWCVPLICVAGAAVSAWKRAERKRVIDQVRGASEEGRGGEALAGLNWQEFEWLVGEAFRQRGFSVVEAGGAGPDGGVDILLRLGDERGLVQCKHWKTYRVGLPVVREMLGAMTAQRARRGWVITSGRFTSEAAAFAAQHGIELVDGDKLPALLQAGRKARQAQSPAQSPALAPTPASAPASAQGGQRTVEPSIVMDLNPSCPRCGSAMVSRKAQKGPSAGSSFWGCSRFPDCRGTRPV